MIKKKIRRKTMNKYFKIIILISISFVLLCQPLFPVSSTIKGIVKEKGTDTPLEKVKITVQFFRKANIAYTLSTNKKGAFYKTGLEHGMYRISFEKEGFVPAKSTFRLMANKVQEFKIDLEAIPQQEKVQKTSYKLVTEAQKLVANGELDKALEKLTESIKNDPENFILYYNRALVYEEQKESAKAISDHKKTIELKPDFKLSLAGLAKLLAKQGSFAEAADLYKKVYDLGTTDTLVLYNYSVCLINLNKSDEAKGVLEKLISIDENYADAYYQLGIIYLGLNDNAKAKECLEKFIQLDPENANVSVAKEILKSM
jgi:tetratricopeptide (TPR) repeat protein